MQYSKGFNAIIVHYSTNIWDDLVRSVTKFSI
jgi:hypothetical protein